MANFASSTSGMLVYAAREFVLMQMSRFRGQWTVIKKSSGGERRASPPRDVAKVRLGRARSTLPRGGAIPASHVVGFRKQESVSVSWQKNTMTIVVL
jgi:hypothetical protein